MAPFNRRFQTGTLGRSVRRWGRFRRPRTGLQAKKFGFYYSSVDGQLELTNPPDAVRMGLVSNAELVPTTSVAVGAQVDVKNVSIDAVIMLNISPEMVASISAFGATYINWGIYKGDVDDDTSTIDAVYATNSLIKWGCFNVGLFSWNGSVSGSGNHTLYQQTRVKFRVSTLKADEEILLIANWADIESKAGQVDLAVISVAHRVRYEIP